MVEESKLEDLKKAYSELEKKYNLPGFQEMNEDFYIERLADTETELLIREIRRFVAERIFGHLRLVESFLNPQNVPMFIFSIIKTLGNDEKKRLQEIYKKLSSNEIELIDLDIIYNEEKEVEFINNSFELFQEVKKEMSEIIGIVKENLDKDKNRKGSSYLG